MGDDEGKLGFSGPVGPACGLTLDEAAFGDDDGDFRTDEGFARGDALGICGVGSGRDGCGGGSDVLVALEACDCDSLANAVD